MSRATVLYRYQQAKLRADNPGVLPGPQGNSVLTPGGIERKNNLMQVPSTEAKTGSLGDFLNSKTQEQYARTIVEHAAKMGIQVAGPLTDQAVLDALETRATWAADKISQTYAKQLATTQANGDTAAHLAEARDYKPQQIWRYELGRARHDALTAFVSANSHVEMMAHVEPGDSRTDDACSDYIDMGTIPAGQIPGTLPLHPNCPHSWIVEPADNPTVIAPGTSITAGDGADTISVPSDMGSAGPNAGVDVATALLAQSTHLANIGVALANVGTETPQVTGITSQAITAEDATAALLQAAGFWVAGMTIVAAGGDKRAREAQREG